MSGVGILVIVVGLQSSPAHLLKPDPARDLVVYDAMREFLDGEMSAARLDSELREYARQFETKPYKVRAGGIDLERTPPARLFGLQQLVFRIIFPSLDAFFKGELNAAQAAVKIAPFILIWHGFGLDPPPEADALWHVRKEQLLSEIYEYAGPQPGNGP